MCGQGIIDKILRKPPLGQNQNQHFGIDPDTSNKFKFYREPQHPYEEAGSASSYNDNCGSGVDDELSHQSSHTSTPTYSFKEFEECGQQMSYDESRKEVEIQQEAEKEVDSITSSLTIEKDEMLAAMRKLALKQQGTIMDLVRRNNTYRNEADETRTFLLKSQQEKVEMKMQIDQLTVEKESSHTELTELRNEIRVLKGELEAMRKGQWLKEKETLENQLNLSSPNSSTAATSSKPSSIVGCASLEEKEEKYQAFKESPHLFDDRNPTGAQWDYSDQIIDLREGMKDTGNIPLYIPKQKSSKLSIETRDDTNNTEIRDAIQDRRSAASTSSELPAPVPSRLSAPGANSMLKCSNSSINSEEALAQFKSRLETIQNKRRRNRRQHETNRGSSYIRQRQGSSGTSHVVRFEPKDGQLF